MYASNINYYLSQNKKKESNCSAEDNEHSTQIVIIMIKKSKINSSGMQ